jgi:hypothetical protein
MQRDTKGYVDGMNLYEYVKTSPINRIDPYGMKSVQIKRLPLNRIPEKDKGGWISVDVTPTSLCDPDINGSLDFNMLFTYQINPANWNKDALQLAGEGTVTIDGTSVDLEPENDGLPTVLPISETWPWPKGKGDTQDGILVTKYWSWTAKYNMTMEVNPENGDGQTTINVRYHGGNKNSKGGRSDSVIVKWSYSCCPAGDSKKAFSYTVEKTP